MIKIENIFSIASWEEMQDSLAKITGMSMFVVDYKGTSITKHSNCCAFCKNMRTDKVLSKYCEKCDGKAAAEGVKNNKPQIYKCSFGLINVAIPIVFQNVYVGALMIGQVRSDACELKEIVVCEKNEMVQSKLDCLMMEYEKIPEIEFQRIEEISNLLQKFCNYIIEREYENRNMEFDQKLNPLEKKKEVKENRIIQQAKKYLLMHLDGDTSLGETARQCNISSSYLSRLFVKETNESFSSFVTRAKIEQAKAWLETNEKSVSEIGYILGFHETGYFIKIFKKHVGMTPGMFRKYRRNR